MSDGSKDSTDSREMRVARKSTGWLETPELHVISYRLALEQIEIVDAHKVRSRSSEPSLLKTKPDGPETERHSFAARRLNYARPSRTWESNPES
jgi:hypothetical protein